MTREEVQDVAEVASEKTVEKTFLTLGIDISNPDAILRLQRNLAFLQTLQTGAFGLGWAACLAAVATIVGGVFSALYVGVKTLFSLH